ncbi:MAG: ATP-dependent DNA helicase, partial [Gammaproteobacteria bacterium]|nr:ATP-dependent DNA helicase [Gammaproteobacteria bacterium]
MTSPSELLADQEHCGRLLPGYAPRQAQLEMADRVDATLAAGELLVLEAGTGIGKTLAYLLPILQGGYRAIVSTGTKALQAQIFDKDLPLARSIAGTDNEVALLKGRANYLCLHRLAGADGDRSLTMEMLADLVRIREWSTVTLNGDRMDIASVDEDSPIWPFVTSTTDNCLGQRCAFYDDCFVFKARRAAAAASVVVVNHHLLMAELVLRDDGYGEILPTADVCIVDEAHQFPDVAAMFLGQHLSSRQLSELVRDARLADSREAGDVPELDTQLAALERASREFRLALGDTGRREFAPDAGATPTQEALAGLGAALEQGADSLASLRERGPELANAAQRAAQLLARLEAFSKTDDPDHVRWTEAGRLGFTLHATPVDPGAGFAARRAGLATSWVFTSATIAVGGSFAYFRERLALDDCDEA